MSKNIEVNIKTENGYEVLYPKSTPEQVGCTTQAWVEEYVSSGYLSLSGGTMTGSIDMGGRKISGVGEPSESGDAVNKGYVDGKIKTFSGVNLLSQFVLTTSSKTISVSLSKRVFVRGIFSFDLNDFNTGIFGVCCPPNETVEEYTLESPDSKYFGYLKRTSTSISIVRNNSGTWGFFEVYTN